MSPRDSDPQPAATPIGSAVTVPAADSTTPESELVPRFWGRLRVFATRRLGDVAAGEDVAQETLRRVTDALRAGRVEHAAALPAFVFQTARHVCLQLRRSAAREARALSRVASGDRTDVNPAAASVDALAALITDERRRTVHHALQALAADDCELLRLAYFDQLNAGEIATRLGSTAGAVRVRKHRALRRLAEQLQPRTAVNGARTSGTS